MNRELAAQKEVLLKSLDGLLTKSADKIEAETGKMKPSAIYYSRAQRLTPYYPTEFGTMRKPSGTSYGKFGGNSGLSYDALRLVAERALIFKAMDAARRHQVTSISKFVRDPKKDVGLRILPKDYYDREVSNDDASMRRAKEVERWLLTPHPTFEPSFRDFMQRMEHEYLVTNRVAIELMRDKRGKVQQFGLIDGALVQPVYLSLKRYIADNAKEFGKYKSLADKQKAATDGLSRKWDIDLGNLDYIYFIDGIPQAGFTKDNLLIVQDNVPVDVSKAGFPSSKVEDAVSAAVTFLNLWSYNDKAFSGTMVNKILGLSGDFDPEDDTFVYIENVMNEKFSGVGSMFTIPLVPLPNNLKLEGIDVGHSNVDMQFDRLMEATISLACATWRMNPDEINFKGFNGDGQAVFEANKETSIANAKEEGFGADLTLLVGALNYILDQSEYSDMMVEPWNLDQESRERRAKIEEMEVRSKKSYNEIRTEDGLPRYDKEYCMTKLSMPEPVAELMSVLMNVPQDANLQNQAAMALQNAQQPQAEGEQPENPISDEADKMERGLGDESPNIEDALRSNEGETWNQL